MNEKTVYAIWCPECKAFYRLNEEHRCPRCGKCNAKYMPVKVYESDLEDEPK